MINESDIDKLKARMAYNATDMGEIGKYVRLEYVYEAIDEMVRECEMRKRPKEIIGALTLEQVRKMNDGC